jgi:8-oxo-dGTP diphosphatase
MAMSRAEAMRVYVGAILLCDACVLLGKRAANRAFYPDVWDVFGGHVESDESLEQALVRELREELGITPIQFTELSLSHEGQADMHEYHLYHVTQWIGTPYNALLEEHTEIRWFPIVETAQLELALAAYQPLFQRLTASNGQRDDR